MYVCVYVLMYVSMICIDGRDHKKLTYHNYNKVHKLTYSIATYLLKYDSQRLQSWKEYSRST